MATIEQRIEAGGLTASKLQLHFPFVRLSVLVTELARFADKVLTALTDHGMLHLLPDIFTP